MHTGTITARTPRAAGRHSYPAPNDDTVFFCRADFQPYVVDTRPRTVAHVQPLAAKRARASRADSALVLGADHPISKQAFGGK